MRITTQMTTNMSISTLSKSYSAGIRLTNQISSMQQVLDLQDNPGAAVTGIKMQNLIASTLQYGSNTARAVQSLDLADAKIGSMKSLLDDAMKLLIEAADSTTTVLERQTQAYEMNSLLQQLLNIANSKDGSRYMFGGTNTGSEPFSTFGKYIVYNGNDKLISVLTGKNSSSAINTTGTDVFGNMNTTISTGGLKAGINLGTDTSTSLSALNGGEGVPKGSIKIYYSAYPDGLEVDLSGCDSLEDVKDVIEKATLEASRSLDPSSCSWLDGSSLDWRDLQDRYVQVTMNPDGNGISLQEIDLGEPLPAPTAKELQQGLDYSGAPGYPAGGGGSGIGAGAVHDKNDYIYGNGTGYYSALRVDNVAGNKVAAALGIKGTAGKYDPANPDSKLDGFIHGADLKPIISESTLLADLEGWNDGVYTITNGGIPGSVTIRETSDDTGNVFSSWNLNNLSKDYNTGSDGELYARVTRRGAPDNDIYVEIYAQPLDKALASDLVASGSTTTADGGTVVLTEANGSGISGSVGILLPTTVDEATVSMAVEWDESLRAVINVPAFKEGKDDNGISLDYLNLFSGWNITGLDKAPASGYNLNHPPSTDLNGNVSVNVRIVDNGDGTSSAVLEIYRPSYDGLPAALVAAGELNLGGHPPLDTPASGRIAITGAEGFESIGGSVYFELPAGTNFGDGTVGTGPASPTDNAYGLTDDLAAGVEFTLGGAMELKTSQTLASAFTLKEDTYFKAGQVFTTDVNLPNGYVLPAGTPLPADALILKGSTIGAGTVLEAGTVLPGGLTLTFSDPLAAGTVIPAGSYTTDGVTGFPADGMLSTDASRAGSAMGFSLQATFATVEDLIRAVEDAGIYASARISDDGSSIEFLSQLAGAYLTISEDPDCYEQMNDKYQQLSALDLNGLIKGVNCDANGNQHTEVIYYPPDPTRTDGKVMLLSDNGEQVLIDAGYYVRVYSSADALDKDYENRDNSTMVAEGFIPAGEWDNTDPLNPFVPIAPAATVGSASPLILEERNGSGVSGTVNFDYYGGRDQAELQPNGYYAYAPYDNSKITISPGGLRTTSSVHTTLQEIDVAGFIPGVHCDYSGVAHAAVSWDQGTGTTTVSLYRDASRSHMTAKGELNAATGLVTLYETDKDGEYILDANGNRVEIGSLVIADNTLLDGQTDTFTITMGGLRTSGQEREDNVFATFADIMDAMNANDLDKLNELIDILYADIDRMIDARGRVSSSSARLTLLNERYADDIISYQDTWETSVGMDTDAFTRLTVQLLAAENSYNAAMAVSTRFMQMSLINYL